MKVISAARTVIDGDQGSEAKTPQEAENEYCLIPMTSQAWNTFYIPTVNHFKLMQLRPVPLSLTLHVHMITP